MAVEGMCDRYSELNAYEEKFCSQNGEDGIIAEIFRRIGSTNEYFVEFGVQNGLECNTAHLAAHHHWSGLLIEGNPELYAQLEMVHRILSRTSNAHVTVVNSFITAENIAETFSSNAVPTEFDFLSIDIDGNDYWVWKALHEYHPRLVAIEYNGIYAPPVRWVMDYNAEHVWDKGIGFGASLEALVDLGESLGYGLVATDSRGVNAFFVQQEECAKHGIEMLSARRAYHPPRYGPFFGCHMPTAVP